LIWRFEWVRALRGFALRDSIAALSMRSGGGFGVPTTTAFLSERTGASSMSGGQTRGVRPTELLKTQG
jgi:hypothetical protein